MPFDGNPQDRPSPKHKCPRCGRFVDLDNGYYAKLPGAADDGFVRVYCSEKHQAEHENKGAE